MAGTGPSPTAQRCNDPSAWSESLGAVKAKCWWGYTWSIAVAKDCSTSWYVYNYQRTADGSAAVVKACNNDLLSKGYSADSCFIIQTGTAKCTDTSAWSDGADSARARNSWPNYWAVAIDTNCQSWYSGWNYGAASDASAAVLKNCQRDYGEGKCGVVASGGGYFDFGR